MLIRRCGRAFAAKMAPRGSPSRRLTVHCKNLCLLSARLGDFSTVASIKFNRAELCDALGDPDKAFSLYEQAMTIRIERGETQDLPQSIVMWAETAVKLGKLDEALKTRAAGLLREVLKMENLREEYGEKALKLLEEINGSTPSL